MNNDDLQKALDYLRNLKVESDKTALVNIDDLLTVLHEFKRNGYKVQRIPKRAIWELRRGLFVQMVYVDVNRMVPRGSALLIDKPKFKPEIRIDVDIPPDIRFRSSFWNSMFKGSFPYSAVVDEHGTDPAIPPSWEADEFPQRPWDLSDRQIDSGNE